MRLISFGENRGASKMILVIPWRIWGNQSIENFAVSKMVICLTNLQHCRNRGCLFAVYWLYAKKEMSLFCDLSLLAKNRGASKMILVIPWSIWGNQSIGNFAVSKMVICLTNLQHCRNRGCLFAVYWLYAKKEMSLFCDLSLLAKIEVPLKWYLWFLEVFEEIRVLETLQYPKWWFASPICNIVEIEVVSLRYISSTQKGDVSILRLISFGENRGASKMILVIPWSIWGNHSIGNLAVSKMAICLTNLQHCRNWGCLFAVGAYIDSTRKRRCLYFATYLFWRKWRCL